ncbi:MAG: hypothetical protein ACLGP3_11635, partial [Acidobacteriota bacterium]
GEEFGEDGEEIDEENEPNFNRDGAPAVAGSGQQAGPRPGGAGSAVNRRRRRRRPGGDRRPGGSQG